MSKVNRSWMAVVAATLLLGTLVGVVWARPTRSPQAADITRKLTLAATDFAPDDNHSGFNNAGYYVHCQYTAPQGCEFTAPVVFPCLSSVTVERVLLHAIDHSGEGSAGAYLVRAKPSKGAAEWLGHATSPAGTGGDRVETYASYPINKVVWPSQSAYVQLTIEYAFISVYGVTIEYHRNL